MRENQFSTLFSVLGKLEEWSIIMWKTKSHRPQKLWAMAKNVNRTMWSPSRINAERAMPQIVSSPIVLKIRSRRRPSPGEPLAFCARCQELTPMQWLPFNERGKRAKNWFQCEYCGNRDLTLRYLTAEEAIRRNSRRETG